MRYDPLWARLGAVALLFGIGACESGSPRAERAPSMATSSSVEDRSAVEDAVRRHWTAINAGDTATILAQHSDDLTIIMAEVPSRFGASSPTMDSLRPIFRAARPRYVIEDLQIQQFGDVAIASFYMSGGVVWQGRHDSRLRRVTEIWVRQPDGSWKEAHHHDSVVSRL